MFAPMQKEISQEKIFNRLVIISGISVFSYLLILSQIYFKERTCFADMSFILFNIIKDQSLSVQVHRFGSAITQIFPLAGVWFGFSLEVIMRLYSASFIIWYFAVFLICVFVFRKPKHGLLMLLFATLMVSDTFYWVTNEQLQGIAFCILFFAFIEMNFEKKISWLLFYPILIAGIYTAAFFHPLVIVAFCFFSFYNWMNDRRLVWLFYTGIFTCFYFLKIKLFYYNNHDHESFLTIKKIPENAIDFFHLRVTENFFNYLFLHYSLYLIAFIAVNIYFIIHRKRIMILILNFSSIIYLFIINTSIANPELLFYNESHYLMLGFFVSIPLCFEILPAIRKTGLLIFIFSIGFIFRCADIAVDHKKFSQRIEWLENFQNETDHLDSKKLFVTEKQVPMDILMVTWGSSYESLLISALKNPDNPRSILIDYDLDKKEWALDQNKSFFTHWEIFQYKNLPEKYFRLNDSSRYVYFNPDLMIK